MNTKLLVDDDLSDHTVISGPQTTEMIRERAIELAIMGGRSPEDASKSDWEQAKLELEGEQDSDLNEKPYPISEDEDEEQSVAERLVGEGLDEAEEEQFIEVVEAEAPEDE